MADFDVVKAEILNHLEFRVTFADGLSGIVRILPSHLYGVFEKLADPDMFRRLEVTNGFVAWPCDIDLAPDAMRAEIERTGEWLLA